VASSEGGKGRRSIIEDHRRVGTGDQLVPSETRDKGIGGARERRMRHDVTKRLTRTGEAVCYLRERAAALDHGRDAGHGNGGGVTPPGLGLGLGLGFTIQCRDGRRHAGTHTKRKRSRKESGEHWTPSLSTQKSRWLRARAMDI